MSKQINQAVCVASLQSESISRSRSSPEEVDRFRALEKRLTWYFLNGFSGHREEALDMVQDTYIKFGVHRILSLPRADWGKIFNVAKFVGIDRIRRCQAIKRGETPMSLDELLLSGFEPATGDRSMDDTFDQKWFTLISELHDSLSPRQQYCLIKVWENLPEYITPRAVVKEMTEEARALFSTVGQSRPCEKRLRRRVSLNLSIVRKRLRVLLSK